MGFEEDELIVEEWPSERQRQWQWQRERERETLSFASRDSPFESSTKSHRIASSMVELSSSALGTPYPVPSSSPPPLSPPGSSSSLDPSPALYPLV